MSSLDSRSRKRRRTSIPSVYQRRNIQRASRYTRAYAPLRPSYIGYNAANLSRGEWKYADTNLTTMSVTSAGASACLNGMLLGTSATTRIGQKITLRSLQMGLFVEGNTASVTQAFRITLVLDRQSNGTLIATNNVFATGLHILTAPRNLDYRKRFRIIYDRRFLLAAPTSDIQGVNIDKYFRFKRGLDIEYTTGNAGTYADIATNALWIIVVGQFAAGTAAASVISGYTRIRFTDN